MDHKDKKTQENNGGDNTAKTNKVDGFRVTTKRDGFRRGGREWIGTTEVPVSEFSKEQIKQLKAEHGKMLIVDKCKIEVAA